MHETEEDLRWLQDLLDASYEQAGSHLREIITPERRLDAEELSRLLVDVQVIALATTTAAGHPRVSPVDGLFFRGRFYFGSSDESVRFRHIRERPHVSATHLRGEELAVTVHGVAVEIDTSDPVHGPFRDYLIHVYGEGWDEWGASAPYARIDPDLMFTFAFDPSGDAA